MGEIVATEAAIVKIGWGMVVDKNQELVVDEVQKIEDQVRL